MYERERERKRGREREREKERERERESERGTTHIAATNAPTIIISKVRYTALDSYFLQG